MSDEWWTNLLPWLLGSTFFVTVIGWEVWESEVRPRLIPRAEIARICTDLILAYGYEGAVSRARGEISHWYYKCDSFEIGKWRRILNALVALRSSNDSEEKDSDLD